MNDRYIPTDTQPIPIDEQLAQLFEKRAPGSVIYKRALDEIIRLRAELAARDALLKKAAPFVLRHANEDKSAFACITEIGAMLEGGGDE